MKSGPILAVLGLGALLGWCSPDMSDQTGTFALEGGEASQRETAERLAAARTEEWFAGEVVLPRAFDGHFYADVSVDGGSAKMLVDTGASTVALTGEAADAMGIYWNPADVRPVARGASGLVYGVPVRLERVLLGQIEAQGVEAVVVPEGLDISLLGQSFLSQIERVEIEQDRMVLGG